MQALWAPWRMEYIKQPKRENCFLCEALKEDDDKVWVVWQGKTCFSLLNRYPYNNGHLMLVPKAHKATVGELSDEELLELMRATERFRQLLTRIMSPEG